VVELASAKKATFEDLKAALPYTDCRFAVFDYEYTTSDGRPADRLFFLSWMPHNATPYSKMAYASGKGMLRETFDGVIDTTCASHDGLEVAFGMVEEKVEEDDGDPEDW
jgi:cofilin